VVAALKAAKKPSMMRMTRSTVTLKFDMRATAIVMNCDGGGE
jgi:hypothetical protein